MPQEVRNRLSLQLTPTQTVWLYLHFSLKQQMLRSSMEYTMSRIPEKQKQYLSQQE